VERIVEELLANTARHTPQDTPVWIRADRQGTGLRLAVEDAGPGMPSEMRTSVFERYRHGETAPTYTQAWVLACCSCSALPSCTVATPGSRTDQAVAHRSRSPCQALLTDTGQSALPSAAGPIGWPNRSPELGAVTVAQREIGSLPNECVGPRAPDP
jgi:hypothetical protein